MLEKSIVEDYESLAGRGDDLKQKEDLTSKEVEDYESECEDYCITYESHLNPAQVQYLLDIHGDLNEKLEQIEQSKIQLSPVRKSRKKKN
jgi:hypothetical protein